MNNTSIWRVIALAMVVLLAAVACGTNDDPNAGASGAPDASTTRIICG